MKEQQLKEKEIDRRQLLSDIVYGAAIAVGFEHFPLKPFANNEAIRATCLFIVTLFVWINDWLVGRRLNEKTQDRFGVVFFSTLITALCLAKLLMASAEYSVQTWILFYGVYLLASTIWNINTPFIGNKSFATVIFIVGLLALVTYQFYDNLLIKFYNQEWALLLLLIFINLMAISIWENSTGYSYRLGLKQS